MLVKNIFLWNIQLLITATLILQYMDYVSHIHCIAMGSVCSNYSWLHNILSFFSHFFRLVWTSRDSRKWIESHTFDRPAWYSCIRKKTIYLVSTRFYYPLSFAIELQRRIFEDLWGGPLILDPWFCSYFRGKSQANLHGVGLILDPGLV